MNVIRLALVFSVLLSSTFDAHATGGGICAIFDDGNILLGREPRGAAQVWSEPGGGLEPGESRPQGAIREFLEETGHYTFGPSSPYKITLQHVQQAEARGDYAEHPVSHYRTYFIRFSGPKPDIQTFHRNAALANHNLGPNAHVEKSDWDYFDPQVLKNAPNTNGLLPGKPEGIYRSFLAVLRQQSAQNILQNVLALPVSIVYQPIPVPPAPVPVPVVQKRAPVLKSVAQKRVRASRAIARKRVSVRASRAIARKRVSIVRRRAA